MEDPIQFDILVHIRQSKHHDAERALAHNSELPRLERLRRINHAKKGNWITILRGASWAEVEEFRQHIPDWIQDYIVCQEDESPESATAYCKEHDLWYGGCLGCHVCNDFYKKR